MTLMSRIITLSVPSLAAINGHGFGAGLMRVGRKSSIFGGHRQEIEHNSAVSGAI
jgi:hypothetical protein